MNEMEYAKCFDYYRYRAGLKKRQFSYYLNSLSIKPQKGQEQAFEAITVFTENYLLEKNPDGLLLVGGVGSGKTFMVSSVVNNIIDNINEEEILQTGLPKHYILEDITVNFNWFDRCIDYACFISVTELFEKLKASIAAQESYFYDRMLQHLKTVQLLVLDDLGAEKSSEWTKSVLFEIIDYRYNEMLPMLITTNCPPKELKEKIGDRSYDRIREMCALVPVTAESQRKTAEIYL